MRLSTNTIYEQSLASITMQQEILQKTQQQLSTGKRLLTPADDPIAAAQVLNISQSDSINTQYSQNRTNAQNNLELSDTVLGGISNLIQSVRDTAVYAGNGSLSPSDRAILADTVKSSLEELIGQANTTDSSGRYLFSGYQGTTKPFSQSPSGVQYAGDQGQRMVQVSASRQIALSNSGSDIFESFKSGNGVFVTGPDASNKGNGLTSSGTVVNPSLMTGQSYQIEFTSSTQYKVTNMTTSAVVASNQDYVSGNAISFDGLQIDISGTPAYGGSPPVGDKFTVNPSSNQSLFKTVENLIAVLKAPVITSTDSARLSNGLSTALQDLDKGLDHILINRASVGSRLQEVDSLQSIGSDLSQQYQQTLSQLQDVDFAKAISNLNQQQAYLEAAQKAFNKVSGLSLFNYM